jgi:hypothetical protein
MLLTALTGALGALAVGCGSDSLVSAEDRDAVAVIREHRTIDGSPSAPAGLEEVPWNGEALRFWPYTGTDFDGEPKDPVNLIFVGAANVLEIRAALLALDGDRTAFGFPAAFPFDAMWGEAIGDVQTGFADGRWSGSGVQLELGSYSRVRTHLRLFETGASHGEDGVWTLGAAHFEITIPGTAEHQVVSWERRRPPRPSTRLLPSGRFPPRSTTDWPRS